MQYSFLVPRLPIVAEVADQQQCCPFPSPAYQCGMPAVAEVDQPCPGSPSSLGWLVVLFLGLVVLGPFIGCVLKSQIFLGMASSKEEAEECLPPPPQTIHPNTVKGLDVDTLFVSHIQEIKPRSRGATHTVPMEESTIVCW